MTREHPMPVEAELLSWSRHVLTRSRCSCRRVAGDGAEKWE
jgi:hypothetical protein